MSERQEREVIEHEGVVREVTGENLKIGLPNVNQCAACHAKAGCSVSSEETKIIEIRDTLGGLTPGEKVRVVLDAGMGPKALVLGYVLPFLLIFTVLIASWMITAREGLSALVALASVIPYYVVLSLFRNKLQKTFSFRISRI